MDDANNHGEVCNSSFLGNIYIYIGQEDAGYSCQHLQPTGAAWVRCRADHAPPKGIGHIRTTVTISEGLQLPVKPGVTKA